MKDGNGRCDVGREETEGVSEMKTRVWGGEHQLKAGALLARQVRQAEPAPILAGRLGHSDSRESNPSLADPLRETSPKAGDEKEGWREGDDKQRKLR